MSDFTPGPWHGKRLGFATFISAESNGNVAAVHSNDSLEGQANARLIVAAPDLLHALKLYVAYRDSGMAGRASKAAQEARSELRDAISAAISKAEGRTS